MIETHTARVLEEEDFVFNFSSCLAAREKRVSSRRDLCVCVTPFGCYILPPFSYWPIPIWQDPVRPSSFPITDRLLSFFFFFFFFLSNPPTKLTPFLGRGFAFCRLTAVQCSAARPARVFLASFNHLTHQLSSISRPVIKFNSTQILFFGFVFFSSIKFKR